MSVRYNMDTLRPDLIRALTGDMIINRYAPHEDLGKACSGGEYKIRCFLPGHNEKTASLCINKSNFMYSCKGKCNASISSGDFIRLIQIMDDVPFPKAVEIAGDMCGIYLPPYEIKETPIIVRPKIDSSIQSKFHEDLMKQAHKLKQIKLDRGYADETIARFGLGIDWSGDWTIPIYENNELVNIKYRSKNKNPSKMKYRSHSKKYNENGEEGKHTYGEQRLFGVDILAAADKSIKVIVCAGEYDAIRICQEGLIGITSTTGEGSWKSEWTGLLIDRDVYICMDNDDAGRSAVVKMQKHLATAKIIDIGKTDEDINDIVDFFNAGHGIDELLKCVVEVVEKQPVLTMPKTNPMEEMSENDQKIRDALVDRIRRAPTYEMNPAFFVDNSGNVYITAQMDLDFPVGEGEQELVEDVPLIVSSNKGLYSIPRVDPELLKNNPDLKALFSKEWKVKTTPDYATRRWPSKRVAEWLSGDRALFSDSIEAYEDIYYSIKDYSKMSRKRYRGLVALYTMGSYFYEAFDSYPYLFVNGEKGSGKTTLSKVIAEMGFNGNFMVNPTAAALARVIDQTKGLIVIDELEQQTKREQGRNELGMLLNAGYQKGASRTICDTENKNKPRRYDIYSPKVLANIFGLNDTLESRCISIKMKKIDNYGFGIKAPGSDLELKKIAVKMYDIMMGKTKAVIDCYSRVKLMKKFKQFGDDPKELNVYGREKELYSPLLAMALFLYEESNENEKWARPWNDLLEELFEISSERKELEEETPESKLRTSLMELMEQRGCDELEANMYELVMAYKGVYVESPGHGVEKWIAKQLRKYDWCIPYGGKLKRRWIEIPTEFKNGHIGTTRKFLSVFTITRRRLGMALRSAEDIVIPF